MNNTPHPGGRPTKRTPALIKKAKEFFGLIKTDPKHEAYFFPSVANFALWLHISRDTVYEWAKEDGEFSDMIETISQIQENALMEYGLKGEYNPTIAKLVLTKHGYSDKIEQDVTSNGKTMGVVVLPQRNDRTEDTLETPEQTGDSSS